MISVAVVGCGAIGGVVARSLRAGEVPCATLKGIVTRNAQANLPVLSLSRALESADLVVEAAGQEALTEIAPQVLDSRASLLVVSVGALRDDATFKLLASVPPGRVHLTTGAVGGLDMLRSAAGHRRGSCETFDDRGPMIRARRLRHSYGESLTETERTTNGGTPR